MRHVVSQGTPRMSAERDRKDSVIEGRSPFATVTRVLFPVALLLCVGFAVVPREWHAGGRLVVTRPWVPWVLFAAPVGCFVALLIGAMISRAVLADERPGRFLGVILVAFAFAFVFAALLHGSCWKMIDSVRADDGRQYALLCKDRFLVEHGEILARPTGRSPFHQSFEVLGENPPRETRDWVPVVRPANSIGYTTYRLAATPGGALVLLVLGTQCQMYYDPKSGKFFGDGQLDWLSPFILIDETAELASDDVKRVIESIRAHRKHDRGRPKRETLVEALEHPNPNVRAAARKMLDAFEAVDEKAGAPL
jgi:hypothetical protein